MSNMTKNAHAVDSSVAERRLRPIYDWLDTGNNKKALQECDKVLKKTAKLQCARALKALTLHRMGKDADSLQILDELTSENPTDEPTLQAMTLCCREMKKLDRICQLYESAAKLDPSNEEIQTQLFMSFVRVSNFKSQQTVAMSLYKHRPKNPYYCWAVMSIILQATRGEGSADLKKRSLLLSLAERMMVKLIQDNKLEAEQEVQLYILILELLDKFEEVLTVLDGPLGKKLTSVSLPQLKLKYMKRLERWGEVNLICKGILLENVDRWDIWLDYVESVFKLEGGNSNECGGGETVDDTCEKAHEFVCRMVEGGAPNSFLLRGPYLARFELCLRLRERGSDAAELLGDPAELFVEYFRRFGYKPCCVSDLRKYLDLLDADKKAELSARLMMDVGISSTGVPQSKDQMVRHICALQLSRLCGAHRSLSPEHQRALVTALSLHHRHGRRAHSAGLLSTDLGPADPYVLLAAHALCDLARDQKDSDYLLVALVMLDDLLSHSPSNFHAKLLAVKIDHLVGNVIGAQEMYNSLDIKHLQLDSLGYIHCARMPASGLFSACGGLLDSTVAFFSSNYKDSSDHLTFSYKFGSFLKLDEFMDFRERLRDSLHYATAECDRAFLGLVECPSVDALYKMEPAPREDSTACDDLQVNYDFGVYVSWDPERVAGPPERSAACAAFCDESRRFLRLRRTILVCLWRAVEVARADDQQRRKRIEDLEAALRDWAALRSDDVVAAGDSVWPPSRLEAALATPYLQVAGKLMGLLASLGAEDVDKGKCDLEELKCGLCELNAVVEGAQDFTYLPARRKTLEKIVNCTELVSISSLVCGLCCDLSRRRQSGGGKRGKKKAAPPSNGCASVATELAREAATLVADAVAAFSAGVENWGAKCGTCDASRLLENLSLGGGDSDEDRPCPDHVHRTVSDSYSACLQEIQTVLKGKVKLLNGLVA